MATNFRYFAIDQQHRRVKGVLQADSVSAVETILANKGLFLVTAKPKTQRAWFEKSVSLSVDDQVELMDALGEMLDAGMPLMDAMDELASADAGNQFNIGRVGAILLDGIRQGERLSAIAAKYPKVFDAVSVGMIQAGEASGEIAESLLLAAKILARRAELKSKILQSLMMPVFSAFAALGALGVWVIYLMPEFIKFLTDVGAEVPPHIQFLGESSGIFKAYWQWIIGGTGFIVCTFVFLLRIYAVRQCLSRWLGRLVSVYRLTHAVRFLVTLGGLYRSGIQLGCAMALCATICDDVAISAEIGRAANGLNLGKSLGSVLNDLSFLPDQTRKILGIGEKSGTLGQSLVRAELLLSKRLQARVDAMVAALPQALALIVGGIFLAIIAGVVLPVYEAVSHIQ